METQKQQITEENLWGSIEAYQGKEFHTAKGLVFTYRIRGGEFFTDRKRKSITRATIEQAFRKVQEDTEHKICGPKTLNCFGAPYIWAVFLELGIVEAKKPQPDRDYVEGQLSFLSEQ